MIPTSDMFKKIKSIFIVEDPAAEKAAAEAAASPQVTGTTSSPEVSSRAVDTSGAAPDPKFTDLLLKAIESNNKEGFDYLEYKNSVRSLEGVIPEETMRFKSAFEMAKTMGLDKEKLIQSASYYLNVLSSEEKKFNDALQNQKAKQVESRSEQMAAMEKGIADKQAMIQKLTAEIEESRKLLDSTKGEIEQALVKIENTKGLFVASYNLVFGQISADIEKIKSNI